MDKGGNEKNYLVYLGRFCQIYLVRIELSKCTGEIMSCLPTNTEYGGRLKQACVSVNITALLSFISVKIHTYKN